MTQLSKVLNRPVLSKYDSCIVGKITNVFFDEFCKNIAYFVTEFDGRSYAVPFDKILSFSDAVVTADRLGYLSVADMDVTAYRPDITGKRIFSASGKLKGDVTDVFFNSKGRVSSITAGEAAFTPSSFSAVGDVLLLKEAAPKSPKRARMPRPETDYKVSVLPYAEAADDDRTVVPAQEGSLAKTSAASQENTQESRRADVPADVEGGYPIISSDPDYAIEPRVEIARDGSEQREAVLIKDALKGIDVSADNGDFTPPRIIADYNFLLNRKLVAPLYAYSGELIAPAGQIVSVETVEQARRNGKLVELTLNSK